MRTSTRTSARSRLIKPAVGTAAPHGKADSGPSSDETDECLERFPVSGATVGFVHAFLANSADLQSGEILSAADIVELALAFANNDPQRTRLFSFLLGIKMSAVTMHRNKGGRTTEGAMNELQLIESMSGDLREKFCAALETILSQPNERGPMLQTAVSRLQNRIAIVPYFDIFEGRLRVQNRVMPVDIRAALYFAVSLLLNPTEAFFGNLCRCQFESCRRFFIAIKPKTGRTRTEYCCEEHMKAANSRKNTIRVAKRRANIANKTKSHK
jgi:hypothetical protein